MEGHAGRLVFLFNTPTNIKQKQTYRSLLHCILRPDLYLHSPPLLHLPPDPPPNQLPPRPHPSKIPRLHNPNLRNLRRTLHPFLPPHNLLPLRRPNNNQRQRKPPRTPQTKPTPRTNNLLHKKMRRAIPLLQPTRQRRRPPLLRRQQSHRFKRGGSCAG